MSFGREGNRGPGGEYTGSHAGFLTSSARLPGDRDRFWLPTVSLTFTFFVTLFPPENFPHWTGAPELLSKV